MPPSAVSSCLLALISSFIISSTAYPQISLDDVHIAPRANHSALSVAQRGLNIPAAGLIRTGTELVMVPVTITDEMNRPVLGLEQENFQLFENKKPQDIRNLSTEDAPLSVGVIIDTSGSMGDKLDRAREAVQQFCNASNPQDEFFMITFADSPRLATGFTSQSDDLVGDLVTAQSKGRTSLLDAIYLGLHEMKNARYSRRALLVLSDGGDNHSRYTEHNVVNAVKESDVMIYSVGIYDHYFRTMEESLGPELLSSISEISGGRSYALENPVDLSKVTRAIGSQLRHQYMLAYRPQTKPTDGKWHKISVKLRLPRNLHLFLRVHARQGYVASSE
jgi:Ca-activated chloride channel homolog